MLHLSRDGTPAWRRHDPQCVPEQPHSIADVRFEVQGSRSTKSVTGLLFETSCLSIFQPTVAALGVPA